MRRYTLPVLLVLALAVGCKRGPDAPPVPEPVEAGSGAFHQLGPVGLRVESVRRGKVRLRGMMGQEGESKEDVFVVRTRFKLLGDGPVKQPALQRDGGMFQIGDEGMKLTGSNGNRFKQLAAGGFDGVKGRRSEDAVLTAESPEATDVLAFESVAGADGDLTLEIPGNYQTQTPEGHFLKPKDPGTFRFRIPKALWSAAPPATDAGPNNWATVGPLRVCVESARVGKLKVQGFGGRAGGADSKDEAFAVTVRTKLADPTVRVKKPPFQYDLPIATVAGSRVALRDAGGEAFPALTTSGFDRIIGRQPEEVELTAERPEVRDLLTFTARAGAASELVLTLYPNWRERQPDGTWADTTAEGEFRFRIPKSTWTK